MEKQEKMTAEVIQYPNGWEVRVNSRTYFWDKTKKDDNGTTAIMCMLADAGYVVKEII